MLGGPSRMSVHQSSDAETRASRLLGAWEQRAYHTASQLLDSETSCEAPGAWPRWLRGTGILSMCVPRHDTALTSCPVLERYGLCIALHFARTMNNALCVRRGRGIRDAGPPSSNREAKNVGRLPAFPYCYGAHVTLHDNRSPAPRPPSSVANRSRPCPRTSF